MLISVQKVRNLEPLREDTKEVFSNYKKNISALMCVNQGRDQNFEEILRKHVNMK